MQKTLFLNVYHFRSEEKISTDTHKTQKPHFPELERKNIFRKSLIVPKK